MLTIAVIHPLTANFAVNARGDLPGVYVTRKVRRKKASLLSRLVRLPAVWYRRQKLVARLEGLDDRLLADIGIERAGISAVAAKAHPWSAPKAKAAVAAAAVVTPAGQPVAVNDAGQAQRVA